MKKGSKIIVIVLVAILGLVSFDTLLARILKNSPLLSIKKDIPNGYVKKGLLMDTYFCTKEQDLVTVSWHLKTTKFYCTPYEIKEIVDKTKDMEDFACDEAKTKFYSDDEYNYYYNCDKSKYVVVKYTSGREESIKNALEYNHITMQDVDDYKIDYIKEEKVLEHDCIGGMLDAYITSQKYDAKEDKLKNIIDVSLKNVKYSYVSKNKLGITVAIQTTDSKVIKTLETYLNKNYKGYVKQELKDNYKIYVYNGSGSDEMNIENDLKKCYR